MSINWKSHYCEENPEDEGEEGEHKFSPSFKSYRAFEGSETTSDISTQVNMDEEFPGGGEKKQNKRDKKRQYKKRKKERQKDSQKYAKQRLAHIICKIYEEETDFDLNKPEVEDCLHYMIPGEKFHTFLNQVIRIHVQNLQNELWNFMQDTIQQNPFQKQSEDQEFYVVMVDKIYEEYQRLQISSGEIQKIINLYMFLKSNKEEHRYYNLDKSTFNYFIESDQTIKNLIKICERKIQTQYDVQLAKLEEIRAIINLEEDFDQKSTSVDDSEENQDKCDKKKKKKKKPDYSSSFYDIVKRITETAIDKTTRLKCSASDDWAHSLRTHFTTNQL